MIQNNEIGIVNESIHDIYALYNTWSEVPPIECEIDPPCDFHNNNGGSIVWN